MGVLLAFIGLGGIPDDVKTWQGWLEPVLSFGDQDFWRTAMVLVGMLTVVSTIIGPRIWERACLIRKTTFATGASANAEPSSLTARAQIGAGSPKGALPGRTAIQAAVTPAGMKQPENQKELEVPDDLPRIEIVDGFPSENSFQMLALVLRSVRRDRGFTVQAVIHTDSPLEVQNAYLVLGADKPGGEVNIPSEELEPFPIDRTLLRSFQFSVPVRLWGPSSFALTVITDNGELQSATWEHDKPAVAVQAEDESEDDEEPPGQ